MKVIINDKEHEILYIEYNRGSVHSVITNENTFDFFNNNGEKTNVRFYNSGTGNWDKIIQASNWVKGKEGKFWLSPAAKLKGKTNGIRVEKPLRVKGYKCSSINPFKIAEETNCLEYCDECGYESTEFCYKHKYEDNEGNERWIHNDEYSG